MNWKVQYRSKGKFVNVQEAINGNYQEEDDPWKDLNEDFEQRSGAEARKEHWEKLHGSHLEFQVVKMSVPVEVK